MKRLFIIIISFIVITEVCFAQHSSADKTQVLLTTYQDSLQKISFEMINNPSQDERYKASFNLIKTIVSALKVQRSFSYNFDSLKTISIQKSPDAYFKIFSWHVMNNDGSYRFYGTIQMNEPGGKLKMFPLIDYTAAIKSPGDTTTSNEKWYGAQYYKIIPVLNRVAHPYYILLGWKGNNVQTTKKVIDILYFKDNKAYFGMPVFENKNNPGKKRIIFEYARSVTMTLNYIPKDGLIAFDHLAPPSPKMFGKFDSYGPDLSYDGYKIINGKLRLMEDLDLKNDPTEMDKEYNDPKKPKADKD